MPLSLNHIWTGIEELRKSLKSLERPFEFAVLSFQDHEVVISINEVNETARSFPSIVISQNPMKNLNGLHSRFEPDSLTEVHMRKCSNIAEEQISFLKQYIPYALLPLYANKERRTITISHFAQTLDGKIATNGGDSKWIGNQENLVHAHRMRGALRCYSDWFKYINPRQPGLNC